MLECQNTRDRTQFSTFQYIYILKKKKKLGPWHFEVIPIVLVSAVGN